MDLAGNILIILGIGISLCGLICYLCCKEFLQRLLVSSVIDSCGFFTIMIGAILRFGFTLAALKVLLILVAVMVINPVTTHEIARLSLLAGMGRRGGEDL